MANSLFSFTSFDFNGIQGDMNCLLEYEKEASMIKGKPFDPFSMEDLGHFFKHPQEQMQQPLCKSNSLTLDDYSGSCFPALVQPAVPQETKKLENTYKPSNEPPHPFSLSLSLDILNNYGGGIKKMNVNQFKNGGGETSKKLSTEEVMKVAGARYIQFSDQRCDDFSLLMHPFGYALSGLSEEETKDVELAHLLLAAAEKVGYQQFDRASRLLSRCEWIASERANPVQRVVYYFAEALRERIDKATGRFTPKESKCINLAALSFHQQIPFLSFHQQIPFNQIIHITEIQAIMENIGSAKKLHLIDLEIRSGVLWTALMQALAEREKRPLEHLKVTAVGLTATHRLEEIGKRLESFAKSMNFPFTFTAVYVASMGDVKESLFKTCHDESVIVVANLMLRTMTTTPAILENLMRVIRNLNPSLMLVAEVESNHNSPIFVNRFIEALFFFSAYFDCLDTCMNENINHRKTIEEVFFDGIRSAVAMESSERRANNVKISVWRAFFARLRMVEIGFSESSLYQASLVPKQFTCGNLCTLDKNGKSLLIGWKGTPLHSLSAWKFSRDRFGRPFLHYTF